jgi:hypothetical protein
MRPLPMSPPPRPVPSIQWRLADVVARYGDAEEAVMEGDHTRSFRHTRRNSDV